MASKMTNEMLAECIESARLAPAKYVREDDLNFHREAIREAAARLRNMGEIGEAVGREETREKSSRVDNAAKMREAVKGALEAIKTLSKTHNDDLPEDVRSLLGGIAFDATEALSAPPRNCDVGTAEEQLKRFIAFCLSRKCNECPFVSSTYGECGVRWSQMPYEGGEK